MKTQDDKALETLERRMIYGPGPTTDELHSPSPDRLTELAAMNHRDYLQTPEWKEKRRLAIAAAEHRCNRCRRTEGNTPLHAHHKTYERLGNEHPDDLEILCQTCHNHEHQTPT